MTPALKRTLRVGAGLLLLAVLAVGGALAWLSTGAGRAFVLTRAERAVPGLTVRNAEGGLFDLGVGTVTLADADGVWLIVEDLRLDWSPLALLARTLRVDLLSAGRVVVARAPAGGDGGDGGGTPRLPVSVDLRRIEIARAELGPGLLGGGSAVLAAHGAADLPSGLLGGEVALTVARIDDRPGEAVLRAAYDPGRRLALDLRVEEPEDGVMAGLLDIPGRPPVTVTLTGDGPPTDWTGALTAKAGDVVAVDAEARIRPVAGGFTFGGTAGGNVAALLPAAARPLVGERLDLAAGGLVRPGDRVALDGLTLKAAAGTLAGQGVYSLADGTVATGFTVEAGPDSSLHAAMTEPVFGTARLEARIGGPLAAPSLRALLTATDPAMRRYAARTLTLDLAADPRGGSNSRAKGGADGGAGSWTYALTAALEGLGADDPELAAIAGPRATLTAAGTLDTGAGNTGAGNTGAGNTGAGDTGTGDRSAGTVRIERFALDMAALTAGGTATATGWGRDLTAAVELAAPDVSRLSTLAGRNLSGALAADIDLTRDSAGLRAEVTAVGDRLGTGIPAADALLGPRTEMAATVRVDDALRLPRLRLDGGGLRLDGEAVLAAGELTARARAVLPDLAPLGDAVGTPLSGGLTVDATGGGPTEALVARLDGRASDLTVNGQPLGAATLRADLRGLPSAPEGSIVVEGAAGDAPLALAGDVALAGDTLRAEDVTARIGPNRLRATVNADLSTGTADGRITADLPDLALVGALAGQAVTGSANATVRLESPGGRQRVVVEATARDVTRRAADGGQGAGVRGAGTQGIGRLRLTGRVDDAVRAPRLDMRLEAADIVSGGGRLARLTATARGPVSGLSVAADLSGRFRREIELAAAGTVALGTAAPGTATAGGPATTVTLERLAGRFAGEEFRLVDTARIAVGGTTIRIAGLDVRSGQARVAVDADLGREDIRAEAVLARIPVAWLQVLDPTLDLGGRLDARATLAGTVRTPRGDLTLRLDDLRSSELQESTGVTGLDLALDGTWRDGRLDLTARAESERGGIDLRGGATLPLVLADGQLAFAVPKTERIGGELKGSVELDRFNDLLAATGDRIGGRAGVDLAVAGTLLDRTLTGTVSIEGGRYENQLLGTTVTDITALLAADPDGMAIRRFTGRTPGTDGTVAVVGGIRFPPGDSPRIDMKLNAERARVAQTDLAVADADAELSFSGGFRTALLEGTVRIREARIGIPERLPRQVVDLNVTEVGRIASEGAAPEGTALRAPLPGRKPSAEPAPEPAESGPTVALALDVTAPNRVYVQGRGLDAEFEADLDVRGTLAEPLVTGQVQRVKGELSLLGQTFELARATLTFQGDGSLDPELDIQARTARGDVTAIVNVSGRSTAPRVNLESEPPAPEDEVLARLLFNRGVGQLSALEAVQLAQSAGQLTGVLGGGPGVLDTVKRSLGVDRLEFRGSGTGEGPGTVAAGRYVGEDVYVGVEQELGTGRSKATVQYDVNENVRLEGAVGTESRVGVQFEWEY